MGFVPVFLVRIGASPFEVSLVTILPAVGGLLLAVPFGRLLELLWPAADHAELVALLAEHSGDGKANAARSAGNQCCPCRHRSSPRVA